MSDHGHHDPGGHELEAINTKLLFRLLISLSFVTVMAAIAVVQWFYSQRSELEGRYAAEGSYQLQSYKAKMAKDLEGVDQVAQKLAANPALLAAPAAPAGWIHPDDLVGAGAAAAAPADAEVEPVPAEGAAEGEVVAAPEGEVVAAPEGEDAAPEGAAAEGAEGQDAAAPKPAAPAEDAPKPAKPPKPAAPAEGEDAPKPAKPAKPAPEPKPADDGE